MSRAQNETRASEGRPRRGRPPGSRTRGTELPSRDLIIPEISPGNVQNRVAGIQGMTPVPVILDRQPISSISFRNARSFGERRSSPRRMYESDGDGETTDNSEIGYFT